MQPSKLIFLFLTAVVFYGFGANGQAKTVNISGKVRDEKGQPVGYATITLLKASDSSLVKGVITDDKGGYAFAGVRPGKYLVAASMIGMLKSFSPVFEAQEDKVLQPLTLKQNNRMLKGVNVTATKPFIEHKPGMTVVNVENSIVSAGNTALEVLKKSPGVSVDNNDNISLRGKQGVTIMINGRETHLSASQVAEMLKSMPASSISKIEIMTSPSAKYDAEGSSGIINIKLKKNANEGFNGTATAGWGQAVYPQANAGINLNYKKGKWSLYGGYHYSHRSWGHLLTLNRQYLDSGGRPTDRMEQPSQLRSPADNHHFNAGVDFSLDTNNTIGFMFTGASSNSPNYGNNTTRIFTDKDVLKSFSKSVNNSDNNWSNMTYNLHYKHVFDTAGTALSANLDYSSFDSRSLSHYNDDFFDANGDREKETERKKGDVLSNVEVKSGKLDFVHPFNDKMKMEAGIKTSIVNSDNDVKYWNYDDPDWVIDSGKTNHFIYTENVNAAYVSMSRTFEKGWSAKAGLRAEQTVAKGEQQTTGDLFERNYLQLFPSLFVQKDIDKNNNIEFAYSRRINRPSYQRLNPFRYYIDPYTYEKGNPLLEPELTRSFELTYIFKHAFTVALNYSHTRDVINEVINVDEEASNGHKVIYDTRDNVGSLNHFSATFTAAVPLTKWWTTNTSVIPMYGHYYGRYMDKSLDNAKFTLMAHSTNTFLLPAGFKGELSGWYHSPMAYGTMSIGSQGRVSAGVAKSLWDNKINIKLNVDDIFDLGSSSGTAYYPNMKLRFKNDFNSRMVNVTVSWNFGNRKLKINKHQSTGIEEEQSRIQK